MAQSVSLAQLVQALEEIAPTGHAEPWDNVGLLVGDLQQTVTKALLTIDYTSRVAEEGRVAECNAVIAYHPPIFKPLKRIPSDGVVHDAIRRGVAIYSPHTALDVADGGTNDVLADLLGLENRSALRVAEIAQDYYKLAVFVPEEALQRVSAAMFEAGAGRIGRYSSCSFRSTGTGTFFGEAGSNPAVGDSGKLEEVREIRVETVLPIAKVEPVLTALRASHPYEEPAFDLNLLAAAPTGAGMGRVGTLASPVAREELFQRIKQALEIKHILVAGPTSGPAQRVAVCAGSCGDLLDAAIEKKADLYLTGEMRHHDALKATAAGLTVVSTLHSNSERVTLQRLVQRLETALPALTFVLSQSDRDPFSIH